MRSKWPWKRLGDHCQKIGSGATPTGGKDGYLDNGPYALIRSQNVYNNGFTPKGLVFINGDQAKRLDVVAVQELDVLLNITGDSVARVCLALARYLPARVNQHVAIIRPIAADFDSRFLRYFLASPYQQDLMLGHAAAGATRNALTKAMIEDFKVPCPPLREQGSIADALTVLDDRIALLRETNATLEAIAQALFKSWFVDFDPVHAKRQGIAPAGMDEATAALFPDSFKESASGSLPKGWAYVSLREVVSIFDARRVPLSGQERALRQGTYPYYGAAALMDHVDSYLFDGVYLLIGEDGSVADTLGSPITQYVWGRFWVNNHAHVLQGKNGVCTEHLMLSLTRTNIQPFITGAVQAKLSQSNMWRILFLRPSIEVAESFGQIVAPLFARFRQNSEQAQTLATLRDTLLPRLISGQLRLPEAIRTVEEIAA